VDILRRVLIISDLHSGHRSGLTHPKYQGMYPDQQYNLIQSELWSEYAKMVSAIKPIDTLIINSDCIDGKGERSGGVELISSDINVQIDMVVSAISIIEPKHTILTKGTPYHTGVETDYEVMIAKLLNADLIGDHVWVDIEGLIFDLRHHISNSTVPHGKGTPLLKEYLWNILWSEMKESQPKSDIIIRSHVHSFCYIGGPNYLCMTTPALQGVGTQFGGRKCSQTVDFGLVWFDVNNKDDWNWSFDVRVVNSQKIEPFRV